MPRQPDPRQFGRLRQLDRLAAEVPPARHRRYELLDGERLLVVHPERRGELDSLAVDPRVVRGVFESMVDGSDHADLLSRMLGLNAPRMFLYGDQNAHLSYLPTLRAGGVELTSIPHSGHWPMYANPVAMWQAIAGFLDRAS